MRTSNRSTAVLVAIYACVFCLTSGIVYEIRCPQAKPLETEGKQLSKFVDPRGDNWIRKELAERGWTREQLDAKDREFRNRRKGFYQHPYASNPNIIYYD